MNVPQLHLRDAARELAAAKRHQENAYGYLCRAALATQRMGAPWPEAEAIKCDITAATNLTGGTLHTVLLAADLTPKSVGIEP